MACWLYHWRRFLSRDRAFLHSKDTQVRFGGYQGTEASLELRLHLGKFHQGGYRAIGQELYIRHFQGKSVKSRFVSNLR